MELPKMELMDWKQLERQSLEASREAFIQMQIAKLLYESALVHIKQMGGLTAREESERDDKHEKEVKRANKAA